MENYPGNGRTSVVTDRRPAASPVEKQEPKEIKKIVDGGKVVRRDKPLTKRFFELFNARAAGEYVLLDVLIPAAKDAFADSVSQGVERMIFGEARSTSRRTGQRPGGHTSYNNYSKPGYMREYKNDPREDRPSMSRRGRQTHDFQEVVIPTRVQAEEIIDQLFELVSKYEVASVAELYEMIDIKSTYTDEKYGWTNLRGAGVQRVRGGYLLDLPRPEPID